jgi:glycosyltransferase involved in cell wall biosynthesis
MKLLIVTPSQGHYGGMEGFVMGLASAALAWPEFEVQVCYKLVGGRELQKDLKEMASGLGCAVHYVHSGDLRLLQLIRWADIVHGQNASPDIIFPALLLGRKVVLTIHNWRRRDWGFHSILWGIGAKVAHRRWYISNFVWNTWEPKRKATGSERVPSVHHLPGVLYPPAERKGFLFLGRWIENKGLEDLVTAYSRAQLDPVRWPLTLLGNGPLKPAVESLIVKLGVKGVEVPGFLDEQSKAKRVASCRWLVAPSNTREDMGVTPIEARSAGVPVIVTRDGGLPEAGGESALIVEPGNIEQLTGALRSAASMSEEEYCERGERGRTTLKDYLRPLEFYRESYTAVCNGRRVKDGAIV